MHGSRLRSTTATSANALSPAKKRSHTASQGSPALSPRAAARSLSPGTHTASPSRATTTVATASVLSQSTLRGPPRRNGGVAGSSVAFSAEENATSISAATALQTGVSLSSFANDGDRFEPRTYETTFAFQGSYPCMALAESTATLWCANAKTGGMDLYSGVTGQLVTSLPTLAEEVRARQADAAEGPVKSQAAPHPRTPRSRGVVPLAASAAVASPSARRRSSAELLRVPGGDVVPACLRATGSHVWVGYTDGTVAVYDALLLQLVTMGQFHHAAVAALALLPSGHVVSASADGLLVLWDTEAAGFEAVTRVTVLLDAVREGAGPLCCMTASSHLTRVFCGFESGSVYSVFLASRPQEQTAAHLLRAHTARVNDMAVVRDLLFTAAEDGGVCVWHCGNAAAGAGGGATPAMAATGESLPHEAVPTRALQAATKLIKRLPVKPCVRAMLAEPQTQSVWVAYADGLLERWSADVEDDFGVEEVVDKALTRNAPGAATSVQSLVSLSAVQTMQWLALSSNGVNKVWYGHKNTLEMQLANSLLQLNEVITRDAEDTAAWREKVNMLKQKEMERREKYICILEQLNEQRVLQRHYARWKQSVLFCGARKRRAGAVAAMLERRTQVQLARRYFGKWASFYDSQQRHMRAYVLSMALSRATEQQQLHACFVAWQGFLVKGRLRRTAQQSAVALSRMVNAGLLGSFFHRWRAAVSRSAQRKCGVSAERLALLAHKAQRQVQQRIMRQWIARHLEAQQQRSLGEAQATSAGGATAAVEVRPTSALSRFAAHYAQLQEQRRGREVLQLWRRWTVRKARHASLAAVAALREQQLLYETRQAFFLRWRHRVHARHTRDIADQLNALEAQLRRAEAEHGDIFEKLQLQRQLDQLVQQQATEEALLAQTRTQLAALEQSCAQLRQRQQERAARSASPSEAPLAAAAAAVHAEASSEQGSDASRAAQTVAAATTPRTSLSRAPGAEMHLSSSVAGGRGHMSANAVFYRSLVDQQRLSPIVLAHMPMEEAVYHVMGQLKGNVVNLYTDLVLFRQVKDRRRAGTSAVGILLEAFGELKRMIVSTVRGASATAASAAARSGMKATRWPLSMEALDCIPVHQSANVLSAIKTIVVAYDLLQPEDVAGVQSTCEELVANADWVFLIARACYLRRKPLPPANNRQTV